MSNGHGTSQALMGSCDVIILLDELSKRSFKVTLAKHDHMIGCQPKHPSGRGPGTGPFLMRPFQPIPLEKVVSAKVK